MAVAAAAVENLIVTTDVPWSAYSALVRELGDGRRLRLAYDEGSLEIMAPSLAHEKLTRLIERFLGFLSSAWSVPVDASGSTTFQSLLRQKGVEPDGSYYVAKAAAMRGKTAIDLAVDPPPDLVVEIDLSRRRLNKRALYAALGVPEFWRHDGEKLTAYALSDGAYVPISHSRVFPTLPIEQVERHLRLADTSDQSAATEAWYAWLIAHKPD